jgi:hypothetical protein
VVQREVEIARGWYCRPAVLRVDSQILTQTDRRFSCLLAGLGDRVIVHELGPLVLLRVKPTISYGMTILFVLNGCCAEIALRANQSSGRGELRCLIDRLSSMSLGQAPVIQRRITIRRCRKGKKGVRWSRVPGRSATGRLPFDGCRGRRRGKWKRENRDSWSAPTKYGVADDIRNGVIFGSQ